MPITRGIPQGPRMRVSPDAPVAPNDGDLWWDTDDVSYPAAQYAPATIVGDPAALAVLDARYAPATRARASKNTSQSIASSAAVELTFPDTESFDTASIHSTVTNSERMTIAITGMWLCSYMVYIPGSVIGGVETYMLVNAGGDRFGWHKQQIPTSAGDACCTGCEAVPMTAGQYVSVWGYQASTGAVARNFGSPGLPSFFAVTYLGPST